MPTLLVLAASLWTLTSACSDDMLWWDRPPVSDFEQVCASWKGQTLCSPQPPLAIGCHDGEVQVDTIDRFGNKMSSVSVPWQRMPRRVMEWLDPAPSCPLNRPGSCKAFDATGRCLSWDRPCPAGVGPPSRWP